MNDKTLIQNVNLLDGNGSDALSFHDIYIEGKTIREICASGALTFGDDVLKHDYSGKTVMPGIIDCHVHLCMEPLGDPVSSLISSSDVALTITALHHMDALLKSGVTYVRGMGDPHNIDIELSRARIADRVQGPHILPAGQPICMTGGHGWQFGTEVDGVEAMRKAVRKHIKDGSGHIKMMATGGVMTPNVKTTSTQLTFEELKVGVEEATNAGLKTATHAQGNQGIRNAVLAGISSVEHGFYLDEEVIEWMIERGTYYVPTLCAPAFILQNADKVSSQMAEKARMAADAHLRSFRLAVKAGVKIALGTDAGTPFNYFGSAKEELLLMIKAGMSCTQAIEAATSTAAELLGISDQYGTLETGKIADLLILEKNPIEVPETILDKVIVYKHGKPIA